MVMSPLTRVVAWVYDRPWMPLIGLLLIVALSGTWATRFLALDVSMEGLLGQETADFKTYRHFVDQFGNDEGFTIVVHSKELLSEQGVRTLDRLHRDLAKNIPGVEKVASIINAPLVRSDGDSVLLATAFDPWPATPELFQQRLNEMLTLAPQHSALLSRDHQTTLLLISLQGSGTPEVGAVQYHALLQQIDALITPFQSPTFAVDVVGQAAFLGVLHAVLLRDIYVLPAAALGISILALYLMFRRRSGVLLPVLAILPPLVITMGAIGRAHIPIQLPTVLIPPSLIVIGIATCVHILTAFYEFYTTGTEKRDALLRAFEHKGRSIVMTTLTTAVAMLSFATASISPISRIGIFGAIGTLLLLASITVVAPLYVRFVPLRRLPPGVTKAGGAFGGVIDSAIAFAIRIFTRHAGVIALSAVVGLVLCLALASRLNFSHQPADWLPSDWPMSIADKQFDDEFHAAISVEIMLDSGQAGGAIDPEFISSVAAVRQFVDSLSQDAMLHGPVVSADGYLEQINTALHMVGPTTAGGDAALQLQRDISALQLVAPELMDSVISQDRRYARIGVRMPLRDGADYKPEMELLERGVEQRVQPPFTAVVTGQVPILAKTHTALTQSAFSSYVLSFLAILLMMTIHVRGLRDGLVAMIPNLLPVAVVLAGMQIFGLSLDMLSMLVVSISMGLVVDDTIHFMGHFHRHLAVTGNSFTSAAQALSESGRAMFITTTVLALGWQMLFISQFEKVTLFGTLTSIIMVLGLAADFVVAPALMVWLYRDRSSTRTAPCPPDQGGAVA